MVYKLVEVDGLAVQKRSARESHGGRKAALRLAKPSGTVVEEVVHPAERPPQTRPEPDRAALTVDLVRGGVRSGRRRADLVAARGGSPPGC